MTEEQRKLCGEYNFRAFGDGVFRCIDKTEFWGTPADLALLFGVEVPNNTQFLRVIDYEDDIHFEYRSYNPNKVRINIHEKKYDY